MPETQLGEVGDQLNNIAGQLNEKYNSEVKKIADEQEVNMNNYIYENLYIGSQSKFFTQQAIKEVIKTNSNKNKKITVKYGKISAKTDKELNDLIKKITKNEYLISYKKDNRGYINQMIIKDV